MGNTGSHTLIPEQAEEVLDLSQNLDHSQYTKHVNGEALEGCLTEFPLHLYQGVSMYQKMNASFNSLTVIAPELCLHLPHLNYLNLCHNHLRCLPESIGLLIHLRTLLVSYNELRALPNGIAFLKNLIKLDVAHNMIRELPEKMGELENLQKLNLTHNKIKKLPVSLGELKKLQVILVSGNRLVEPPQEACDSGSAETLRHLKKMCPPRVSFVDSDVNNFPRVRGNVLQSHVINPDSARAQYIQMQTQTHHTASRIRTPLLPPQQATLLQPDQLKDAVAGLVYGVVIGDALGLATDFMNTDECLYHYDSETITYQDIISDDKRVHWTKGDFTENSEQMFVVLDCVLGWAGVIDELDFATRLKSWSMHGLKELRDKPSHISSCITRRILKNDTFTSDPHKAAEALLSSFTSSDVDNGALSRAPILGIPHFHSWDEVYSNTERVCRATHADAASCAAADTIALLVATVLQGRCATEEWKVLLNDVCSWIEPHIVCCKTRQIYHDVMLGDKPGDNSVRHPFTTLSVIVEALKTTGGSFSVKLRRVVMRGGHASLNSCLLGAIVGGQVGYSKLPRDLLTGLVPATRDYVNAKVNALLDMMAVP